MERGGGAMERGGGAMERGGGVHEEGYMGRGCFATCGSSACINEHIPRA